MKKLVSSIPILLFYLIANCQLYKIDQSIENNLLNELEQHLNLQSDTLIPGNEHPDCNRENQLGIEILVDSTILVRKRQPDKDQICQILYRISKTRDTNYIKPLILLYNEHLEFFSLEWGVISPADLYYCEIGFNQGTIMNCFEHAISALDKAELSVEELENEYSIFVTGSLERNAVSYIRYIGSQHFYSPYFKNLIKRGARFERPFSWSSLYLTELTDFNIQKVLQFEAPMYEAYYKKDPDAVLNVETIFFVMKEMEKRKSRKFEIALEDKFDEFAKTGYVIRIFEYAQKNHSISDDFALFLMDKIYTHERFKADLAIQESFTGIVGYLINEHTRPTIKQYLIEKLDSKDTESRLRSLSYLVYFSNEPDVLDLMLTKGKQRRLSTDEVKVLKNNYLRMLKAPDFSEGDKEKVRSALTKLNKKENKSRGE